MIKYNADVAQVLALRENGGSSQQKHENHSPRLSIGKFGVRAVVNDTQTQKYSTSQFQLFAVQAKLEKLLCCFCFFFTSVNRQYFTVVGFPQFFNNLLFSKKNFKFRAESFFFFFLRQKHNRPLGLVYSQTLSNCTQISQHCGDRPRCYKLTNFCSYQLGLSEHKTQSSVLFLKTKAVEMTFHCICENL